MCIGTLEKGKISKARLLKPLCSQIAWDLVNAGLTRVWAGLAATCLTGSQEMALPGMRGEHGPAGSLTLPHGSSVVVGKLLDLSELQISHI